MQTPVRHSSWKRAAAVNLMASCVAAALSAGGCQRDAEKADVRVNQDIQKANEKLGSRDGVAEGIQTLQMATKEAAASNVAKVEANSALAQAEARAGDAAVQHFDEDRVRVAGLLARLSVVSSRIRATNQVIAGFRAPGP